MSASPGPAHPWRAVTATWLQDAKGQASVILSHRFIKLLLVAGGSVDAAAQASRLCPSTKILGDQRQPFLSNGLLDYEYYRYSRDSIAKWEICCTYHWILKHGIGVAASQLGRFCCGSALDLHRDAAGDRREPEISGSKLQPLECTDFQRLSCPWHGWSPRVLPRNALRTLYNYFNLSCTARFSTPVRTNLLRGSLKTAALLSPCLPTAGYAHTVPYKIVVTDHCKPQNGLG